MNEYMKEAIKEAYNGIHAQDGGPFGTVIVKDNHIVGRGHNRVLAKKDSTCHGEMEAIRDACRNLGSHDLSGCELYTTAEPCPMCLGAILWSNISRLYYGCNCKDTKDIGFRDDIFYDYLAGKNNLLQQVELDREECLELFKAYKDDENRKSY
ncbi:MAG: nucleoside deaminase [Lachnospiraceae bacterium]|nr:nucleoside deaminase [Lachnospiraceae bacterium]